MLRFEESTRLCIEAGVKVDANAPANEHNVVVRSRVAEDYILQRQPEQQAGQLAVQQGVQAEVIAPTDKINHEGIMTRVVDDTIALTVCKRPDIHPQRPR